MALGKEARLILKLVDGVSGPARGIVSSLGAVGKSIGAIGSGAMLPARALSASARQMRTAANNLAPLGASLTVGLGGVAKQVYNMEKQLNISVAAGNISLEQRQELMRKAVALNADYAATSAEIVAGTNELLKAGLNYDQSSGAIEGILDTAQAMDVGIADASAAVVNSMTSLRMEMKTTDQAMKSSKRIADLYAYAVNETTAGLEDFATSGKYFNPVAAAMGMSPEEAMAFQVALAKAGIKGSSAGTGLRSAPVSIAAPTKGARAALAGLGLDSTRFVGRRRSGASGSTVAAALEAAGIDADGMEGAIDKIIADKRFKNAPAKAAKAIIAQFQEQMDVLGTEDRQSVAESIQNALIAGVSEVDMAGFLKALRDRGAGIDDYAAIFGKQHASKMMAIDPDQLANIIAHIGANATGQAKRMREAMMGGIVGDVAELTAAVEKMSIAIGQSGLLRDASKAIDSFASSLSHLADTNPHMVRFASYVALAFAALAPLGFAISGVTAALALMVNPLALAVAGIAALAAINFGPIKDFMSVFASSFATAIDPGLVKRIQDTGKAIGEFFSLKVGEGNADAFGQTARNWGIATAEGINAAYAAIPQLKQLGGELVAFGQGLMTQGKGIWDSALPGITRAMDDMKTSLIGFATQKWDGLRDLGGALADFGARAAPFFEGRGVEFGHLVGSSFEALAAGLGAVGRFSAGAFDGVVSFFKAFLEGIDGNAVKSLSDTLGSGFRGLASALNFLKEAYSSMDFGFLAEWGRVAGGATGAVLGEAIKGVAAAIQAGADALMTAATALKAAVQAASEAAGGLSKIPGVSNPFVGRTAAGTLNANPLQAYTGAANGPPVSADGPREWDGVKVESTPLAGKRAAGGPIRAGLTYQVNEKGVETVTLGRNGYVTPAGRGGISGPININIYGATNPEATGDAVASKLSTMLQRSTQVGIDGR